MPLLFTPNLRSACITSSNLNVQQLFLMKMCLSPPATVIRALVPKPASRKSVKEEELVQKSEGLASFYFINAYG